MTRAEIEVLARRLTVSDWDALENGQDCLDGSPLEHTTADDDEALLAYRDEMARLVRSRGCVRCLRRVVGHGPSTTHPHVDPVRLDILTSLGLLGADGWRVAFGHAVARALEGGGR